MVLCTKIYVRCGTEIASTYTMVLQNKKKENLISLGHVAVKLLAKRKTAIDASHCACLPHVSQVLQVAQEMQKNNGQSPQIISDVLEDHKLAVNGFSLRVGNDSKIFYGMATVIMDKHQLNTDSAVLHTETVYNGVPVQVTTIFGTNAAYSKNILHFVGSSDTKCVNVRSFKLGRRCQSNVIMQPMMSYFLRKERSNNVHKESFRNLGMEFQNTTLTEMPLYDVMQSVSGNYVCYSIFI